MRWLVTGRSGDDGLQVILASTGERLFELPSGVADSTWSHVVSATTTGKATTVRDLRIPELEGASQTIDGAWRLPTVGMDPTPVGVSDDGRTIVLVEEGEPTRPRAGRASRSSTGLRSRRRGSSNCPGRSNTTRCRRMARILYVVEHLAGPPDGHYQVRAVDTATGTPACWSRRRQERGRRGDGRLADRPGAATRRDGLHALPRREHPFIHALSSVDAWALCIDLPATGGDDPAAAADWGLTATTNGRSIVAANATLGVAVEIPLSDLAVRRIGRSRPSASTRGLPRQVRPPGRTGSSGAGSSPPRSAPSSTRRDQVASSPSTPRTCR